MISCFANNVKQAYIYIRGEFPHGARILEKAIAEARAANLVGPNILGTNYSCEIYVHRGAGDGGVLLYAFKKSSGVMPA